MKGLVILVIIFIVICSIVYFACGGTLGDLIIWNERCKDDSGKFSQREMNKQMNIDNEIRKNKNK